MKTDISNFTTHTLFQFLPGDMEEQVDIARGYIFTRGATVSNLKLYE